MEFELSQREEQIALLGRRKQIGAQGPDRRVRLILIQLEKVAVIQNLSRHRTGFSGGEDIGRQSAMDVARRSAAHTDGIRGAGEHLRK
jgi:hypothetical protein